MSDEARIMRQIADLIHAPATRTRLLEHAAQLRRDLEADPAAKSTAAAIPLETYGAAVPTGIGSSWVFVLRADHDHPAERHPNSVQRMFALDSPGAMEVWTDEAWLLCPLSEARDDPGLSIPAYAWHRPARLPAMWGVVSFHTVAAADLIEEVGDPASGTTFASRHYLGG